MLSTLPPPPTTETRSAPQAPARPWRRAATVSLPEPPPPRRRRSFGHELARGIVLALVVNLFMIQVSVVRGKSMQPNLHDGDRLVVDCVSHGLLGVDRFDVVVMRSPADPEIDYVKRVVGLPGDRIGMWNGVLTVNGEFVDEGFEPIRDLCSQDGIQVPEGYFFVLGDNRPISADSRSFGLVPAALLRGEVRLRFWPLDRFELF